MFIIGTIFLNNEKNEENEKNKTTKTCSYGYKLYNNKCKIDYFIIVVNKKEKK